MKAIRLVVVTMLLGIVLMGCMGNTGGNGNTGNNPIPPSLDIVSAEIDNPTTISLRVVILNTGGTGEWRWETTSRTFDENGNEMDGTITQSQSGRSIAAGAIDEFTTPGHYTSGGLGSLPSKAKEVKVTFKATVLATGSTAETEVQFVVPGPDTP